MAGADLVVYDAALKETWTSDRLEEQLYNENPFLERIQKTSRYTVGQQAVTPLHTSRNSGYTAASPVNSVLNPAGAQGANQATWQYAHHNQQVKIEGAAIDGTSSNVQSVVDVIDFEVEGAVDDLKAQISRQLFMDGSGQIAQCGVTTASATIVLEPVSGYNALERGWLYPGAVVDIGTSASEGAVVADALIASVTESVSAPTITLSTGTPTTSASHFVSWANSRAATVSREMNGLRNIVSQSAVLGGLDPATVPVWKAAHVDTTAQAVSPNLLTELQRKIRQRIGGNPDYVITSTKQKKNLYDQLQIQVNFAADAVGAGNVAATKWAGMTIEDHPQCPNEDLYMLTLKRLFILATAKPQWQNSVTGGNVLAWIQGTNAFGANLNYRMNLGTDARNAHARLGGLS